MNVPAVELTEQTHRRGGGRVGRKALRSAPIAAFPTLVRNIPVYEIVPDEAVAPGEGIAPGEGVAPGEMRPRGSSEGTLGEATEEVRRGRSSLCDL